ncbi:methyltransferase domain-containing protein [bacterium]|nr:methyltransferase domain-containing protein [bacterium]
MPEYKDFDMRVEEMETEQLLRRVKFHLENPDAQTSRPAAEAPKAADFDNLHLGNEMYFQLDYAAKIYDPRTVPQNTRFRRIKGLLMRVMRLYATRQVEFNATVVKLLNMFQDRFEETVERFNYFRSAEVRNEEALRVIDSRLEQLEKWGAKVDDIAAGVAAVQDRLQGLENAIRALAESGETAAKRLAAADESIKAIGKFNEETVKRLDAADEGIRTLGKTNEETAKRLSAADEGIKTLGKTNEETAKRLAAADESIKAIGKLNEGIVGRLDAADEGIKTLGKTNEETAKRLAAADEGIKNLGSVSEQAAARLVSIEAGFKELHGLVDDLQLRNAAIGGVFSELKEKLASGNFTVTAGGKKTKAERAPSVLDDFEKAWQSADYELFEDESRGDVADIRERLGFYVPLLEKAACGGGLVADLGCGRGELLELLKEKGLSAIGIDNNEAAVIRGKKAGLNMECKDLFQYLREAKEGSLAAVTAMHVIEHLTPSEQGEFLALSLKALKPGGLIAMETPNIMNLHVASCDFYSDITHVRPVHPVALRNRMKQMGYKDIDIKFLHPFPQNEQLTLDAPGLSEEAKKNFEKINDLIWGCRDCVILATKKEKI